MSTPSPRPGPLEGGSPPGASPWWIHPGTTAGRIRALDRTEPSRRHYRFGDGFLRLVSGDPLLDRRFAEIYGECGCGEAEADPASTVTCRVLAGEGSPATLVSFEDPEPLNTIGLYQLLFEEWGYTMTGTEEEAGWWRLAFHLEPDLPLVAGSSRDFLFDRSHRWQPMAGQLALNRVLMLQRRTLFFHAGSVAVGGAGAILAGGKGRGKTTLALALASRGHGFLGDEIAAVGMNRWDLLPFRRAASIRRGPAAAAVERALAAGSYPEERHPDGSRRTRVPVGKLFPAAPGEPAPLRALFVLLAREPRARAQRIAPRREHLVRLPLLRSTMWEAPVARRFIAVTRALASAALFHLHPGEPDETADLIEKTMESL